MMISLIWCFPLVFNQTLGGHTHTSLKPLQPCPFQICLAISCLLYDFLGIAWIKGFIFSCPEMSVVIFMKLFMWFPFS